MFVFSPGFTRQSKLAASHLADLNELCKRDYGKAYFPGSIICLDLDAFEASRTGNNDATMDAATGMADWQKNHSSNDRHLLIERYRLRLCGADMKQDVVLPSHE